MNRRSARNLDLSAWPEFDDRAVSKPRRKGFAARRKAIELYVANVAVTAIEAATRIRRAANSIGCSPGARRSTRTGASSVGARWCPTRVWPTTSA